MKIVYTGELDRWSEYMGFKVGETYEADDNFYRDYPEKTTYLIKNDKRLCANNCLPSKKRFAAYPVAEKPIECDDKFAVDFLNNRVANLDKQKEMDFFRGAADDGQCVHCKIPLANCSYHRY